MNCSKSSNNDNFAENQYNKMVNTPVSKLITSLAIPTVISMLVTSIYNMADTFFVSQISTQASAAVGVVFPIMSIIQAFGFTLGMGSGSLISIRLGQKRNEEANVIVSTAFFTAIGIGLLITILGIIFSTQFLSLVGASNSILPYAQDYAKYIFFGAPIMTASFVLNNVLRSEGKAFFSMIGLTTGGILNIILDPIFIYALDLGISGAAIATLCSQSISFLILLTCFLKHKTVCHINIKLYSLKKEVLPKIVTTGFPSLSRQGLASISSILLNTAAGAYGDAAIAGMTITTKIVMFIASIMIGVGQGFSPVSGYNFGAKRYDRVKQAYTFTLTAGFILMGSLATIIFIFANQIMNAFINDLNVVKIGVAALRWQVAFLPFHSLIIGTNMLMQSTRHIKSATYLSMNRNGIYFIPAILILPRIIGLQGVEMAQFVADVLSAITAVPFAIYFFKKMSNYNSEQN
jgi:putative MATE family efflux protein